MANEVQCQMVHTGNRKDVYFHTGLHKHILQMSPGYYKRFMLNSFLDMLCAWYTLLNNYNKKRQGQIVSICASVGYCVCVLLREIRGIVKVCFRSY